VIKHLDGLCHVYIDSHADPDMAISVAVNSKVYRFGICGAMETLLVHKDIAADVLPGIARLLKEKEVALKGCEKTRELLPSIESATEDDWRTEYLAPMLSIRVVDSMQEAIEHIGFYGSAHTDSIVTEHLARSREFIRKGFADGYQYGLGAEIGISTDRLHVRGPVGLEGLTTEKYVVIGNGTIRS